MQRLSDSIAIGVPMDDEGRAVAAAVLRARKAAIGVDVVIGIGLLPRSRDIPVRTLGFASCATRAIREDLRRIVGPHTVLNVRLFSTATKLAELSGERVDRRRAFESGVRTLATLVASLRMVELRESISVDLADSRLEVQEALANSVQIDPELMARFRSSAANNSNGADPQKYAIEHAAPSMFGDLRSTNNLQVTLAGIWEAPFWAVRRHVARLAARGQHVAPSLALMMVACRRPWYAPTDREPTFGDISELGIRAVRDILWQSFDPAHGGNCGLAREAQRTLKILDKVNVTLLRGVSNNVEQALHYLSRECVLGPNLSGLGGMQI